MSKKYFLISIVLAIGLAGIASAQPTVSIRKSWWSDWGTTHDWNEPNNWYTRDHFFIDDDNDGARDYQETMWFVKVSPNTVPDLNIPAFVGKGGAREVYPRALRDYVLGAGPMTDPTIGAGMVAEANSVQVGGGESFDPNVGGGALDPDPNHDDPNRDHYLWMTGGTLTVGTPQTWWGYDYVYSEAMFWGQWSPGRLSVAQVPSPGSGTMYMSDGTVDLGGHMEVGGWGATGLLDMTGGTINMVQGFYCPSTYWGAVGQANLHGGTINAGYLTIVSATGSSGAIDFGGGKMVLGRNQVQLATEYASGAIAGASITAYGVGHGEIITDPNSAEVGKRAALSIDYDVSNEAKTTIVASATDPCEAWNPSPADGAASVKGPPASLPRPILSWSAGDDANTHDVYFGPNEAWVTDATTSVDPNNVYMGNQNLSDVNYTVGTDLAILTQYFWRIDEVNVATVVKGDVWDFTMANLGKASYPSPDVAETGVATDVTISWTPGIYAVTHDVYFGTSFDDVNEATTSVDPNNVYMGPQGPNTFDVCDYDPNALAFSTTYYWRIDEVDGGTYPGNVWSFTTAAYLTVEDFDSYVSTTELYTVWDDMWVNLSGAQIFVDKDLALDGNSVRFDYDCGSGYKTGPHWDGSFIDANIADLEIGSDWTISEAKALVLNFFGTMGNDANVVNCRMWVELEDTSSNAGVAIYDGDPCDVTEPAWHEWNIDLAVFDACGVSLGNVDKVHIGFGNQTRTGQGKAGGTGTVYFDDIQVHPRRCVPVVAYPYGDLTGDCVIDGFDVEAMSNDWLVGDFNTIGFDGTLINYANDIPGWVPAGGQVDGALQIVAAPNDYNAFCAESGQALPAVAIPPLYLNSNAVTFTAWVKRDGHQCDWMTGIIFQRDGDTTAGLCFGNKPVTRNDLAFNWDDLQASWGWDSGLTTPNDQWFFAGLVVSQSNVTIHMYDGAWSSNTPKAPKQGYPPEPFEGTTYIGQDDHANQARNVIGWIDDARIYDYPLTQGQIQSIVTTGEPNDAYVWYKLDEGSGLIAVDSGSGGLIYHPNPSPANYYDGEVQYQRYVNFRDYDYLARNWLKEFLYP